MNSFRRRFQYQNNRNSLKENTQIDKKEPETEIKEITITKAPLVENNKEKYRFKKREKKELEKTVKNDNDEIKKLKEEKNIKTGKNNRKKRERIFRNNKSK